MEIKPIETEYNGYRFRSRLEARWAVLFDALGVKYEYEPEGFELPSGKKYLPDFRVRCYGMRGACAADFNKNNVCESCAHNPFEDPYAYEHCEYARNIEGSGDNGLCGRCDSYRNRAFDLYIEVKGKMTQEDADRIAEFAGSPFDENGEFNEALLDEMNRVLIVGNIPGEGQSTDSRSLGVYEPMDGISIYPFNYELIDGDYFGAYPAATSDGKFYLFGDDANYINWHDKERVEKAYRIARQARFEHGETPAVKHG